MCFANIVTLNSGGYVMPVFQGNSIAIKAGRHPVVEEVSVIGSTRCDRFIEQAQIHSPFTPNDCFMTEGERNVVRSQNGRAC